MGEIYIRRCIYIYIYNSIKGTINSNNFKEEQSEVKWKMCDICKTRRSPVCFSLVLCKWGHRAGPKTSRKMGPPCMADHFSRNVETLCMTDTITSH